MATTITAAQSELISSLLQEEIPIKLRCAICSRLAVNAFRLPCCEQSVCETCQSTLPSSCPVCEHTPVAAEDCKPNKALRTTIKVFLRTEEKKREALRLKEDKNTPPDTPIVAEPSPTEPPAPLEAVANGSLKESEDLPSAEPQDKEPSAPLEAEQKNQAEQDIPQQSIEEIAPGQEPIGEIDGGHEGEANTEIEAEEAQKESNGDLGGHISQTPGFGPGFGFDPSAAGPFPGMGFGGDMSQMQMMMGMGPGNFGNFPMMGMPGMPGMPAMGMDPMMMQNMFMSGGFGAGMNGMGMGMGGFDGGMNTGFNGWNGQQSFNIGPEDNFNPNASSMGHGDYGPNNSGYTPHAGGYDQGNYGRSNQYNNYQNSYGYRGRARGRGGYGRGGYGYGSHDQFSQQFPQQFGPTQQSNGPISETGSIPTGPKADTASATPGDVDEFGREIRPTKEETPEKSNEDENAVKEPGTATTDIVQGTGATSESLPKEVSQKPEDRNATMPIQTLDEIETAPYFQDASNSVAYNAGFGPSRGGFSQGPYRGGRGAGFSSMQPPIVKPVDVPINAPKGPKAMREGLPNTGLSSLRGRGFAIVGRTSSKPSISASASAPPEPSNKKSIDPARSKSPSRERDKSRSKSRERKRSRSRSRSRERHHRRHRHQSTSLSEDEKETERRRERRRERRHRHEEDDDPSGDKVDDSKRDSVEERSRSVSPSDPKRSAHRSRRDKDKYRERDRESDREHKSSSHKHRSSYRSHHDDRERSRSRDRDREHRHRHSRHHTEEIEGRFEKEDIVQTPVDVSDQSRRPSVVSNGANGANGLEIKGASARRKNTSDETGIPTGPRQDRISTSTRDKEKEKTSRHYREEERRTSHHESSRSSRDKERERERERERKRETEKEPTKSKPIPTGPAKDPHELEREARNRERLLKEAQRIAGLAAGLGTKRSRDEGDDGAGRRGKKKGRRGGAVMEEDASEEARISRLEAERESARWG